MMVPPAWFPTDLHENRRGKVEGPERKVRLFTAAVFVASTASVAALLLYLGQGAFASSLAGFFVGATAAIEVGRFGGRAFFGEDGDA
jgi:hypothetical protein